MCGIVFSLSHHQDDSGDKLFNEVSSQNTLRGPDRQATVNIYRGELSLKFFASVLHLRGGEPTPQPHTNQEGDIFCWNGEVFEGLPVTNEENDGRKLFEALEAHKEDDISTVFSGLEGPYAFVYYKQSSNTIYFARDPLGRRSLLIHRPTSDFPNLLIASTATSRIPSTSTEVPPTSIFALRLSEIAHLGEVDIDRATIELSRGRGESHVERDDWVSIPPLCTVIPSDTPTPSWTQPSSSQLHYTQLFTEELEKSVRLRVQNIPKRLNPTSPRLALLFSGGIDCTVLAYLAHMCLPIEEPIDLLNVAFENPRSLRAKSQEQKRNHGRVVNSQQPPFSPLAASVYDVPDRLSGLEELEELRGACPGREWRFVEIDITYEESQRERPTIEELMLPSRTVMDLSLALALYFASRGRGIVREARTGVASQYTSEARVLLSGLGSDELLGGYARHRNAFSKGSWQGLIDELQLDLDRLPTRNLGRDDRVISTHGKETRYPFLSLSFVSFVANIPVEIKVDPRLEEGRGDKMILRMVAERMGLAKASARRKRAMQFGSRSARMEGNEGDRKGTLLLT